MRFTLYSRQTPKLITVKKIILFSALLVSVFVSCKKNNSASSSSNYHFTATIDGAAQTFNVSPLAVRVVNGPASEIAIEGFAGTSTSTSQVLAISWANTGLAPASFTTGNYSDTASNYAVTGTYNPSLSVSYVSGSGVTGLASGSGVTIVNHLKFTITSLDSTAVKGTFSGDFYYNGDISGAKKTITNGDFFVPWKK